MPDARMEMHVIHYIDCAAINVEGHKCNCTAYSEMEALRSTKIDLENENVDLKQELKERTEFVEQLRDENNKAFQRLSAEAKTLYESIMDAANDNDEAKSGDFSK
jgi:hypothetical protein